MKAKNCPFCGCKPKAETFQDFYGFITHISCPNCGASISSESCKIKNLSVIRANSRWNRRLAFYPRDLYEVCYISLESCDEPERTFYNKIMEAVSEYERQTALKNVDLSRYDTDIDF